MSRSTSPLLPRTAPFGDEQIAALNQVLAASSAEQRHWLAGFLAGYAAAAANDPLPTGLVAPAPAARTAEPLLIVYGTESGNAEMLAGKVRDLARRQGFKPTLRDMADIRPTNLASARHLVVIASTWGEGEPPQRAIPFYEGLLSNGAPRLDGVRFAVLALGDTSYANFCEIGRRIDARLEALGALRVADRVDCDLDFEAPAASWTEAALQALKPAGDARGAEIIHLHREPAASPTPLPDELPSALWSRVNPFAAEILEQVALTSSRSTKQALHVELSLEGSGLAYQPGDSLAVVPENDPAMIEAVLKAAGIGGEAPLTERLRRELDITTLSKITLEKFQALRPHAKLSDLLSGDGWRAFIADRQLVDVLQAFPCELSADELGSMLRRLPERSYSIASSPLAHEGEAHLLVGAVRWAAHGRARSGVTSGWLADRAAPGDAARVFLKPNRHFRLPEDQDRRIVMVGPGTGLAPFRAFLEHRREQGAKGRNWLVFGERTSLHEFYYQLELQGLERDGYLHRLDVAFSRDQPEKIYVQDRLWQARRELWTWLEDGAHLYVCGDASMMSRDVDQTLTRIAADQGGLEESASRAWLTEMARSGRLQRDVY